MGKSTLRGLRTEPRSNESFVLIGGPMKTKRPSKSKSKDDERKPLSKSSQTEESEDHGASAQKPSSSEASPTSDSQTED